MEWSVSSLVLGLKIAGTGLISPGKFYWLPSVCWQAILFLRQPLCHFAKDFQVRLVPWFLGCTLHVVWEPGVCLMEQTGLSTYHTITGTHNRRKQSRNYHSKSSQITSLSPELCHLGRDSHPSLHFKAEVFHKWSTLVWENLKQSQKGEVSGICFSMGPLWFHLCLSSIYFMIWKISKA